MQSNPQKLVPELRVVEISQPVVAYASANVQEGYNAVIKGRLAKQRLYEVEALLDRLKATERYVGLLERTLTEIQPHFFEDHPVWKKISIVLGK